jgi:uncharacterized protein (TIGR02996 family)
MTTREQLIRAVIAAPDADAPREAFAAWGIQHGDLQGELTRIQLAEARERRTGTTADANLRYAEAQALIEQHGAAWAHEVLAIATHPRFFRGFVEAVVLDVPTFLTRAADLYAVAPIRSVVFIDAGPYIEALAASEHLTRLVAIEFYNRSGAAPLGDAGLRTFAGSPHLGKLALLQLAWNEIGLDGVEALAASKMIPSLRDVAFGNNPVGKVTEEYAEDALGFEILHDSISLPQLGRMLEAKYGELRWLHAPSSFRMFPPNLHDV